MTKKKIAIALAAAALAGTCAIGGTLAWLTDAKSVTNTFTVGSITASIAETTGNDYKIVPGVEISKDPTITIARGSEKCYVFAHIANGLKINNESVATFNLYDAEDYKWVLVDGTGTDDLYILSDKETGQPKVVDASTEDQNFKFFNAVTVDGDLVDSENIAQLNNAKVDVAVYAHQSETVMYSKVLEEAKGFDFTTLVNE